MLFAVHVYIRWLHKNRPIVVIVIRIIINSRRNHYSLRLRSGHFALHVWSGSRTHMHFVRSINAHNGASKQSLLGKLSVVYELWCVV